VEPPTAPGERLARLTFLDGLAGLGTETVETPDGVLVADLGRAIAEHEALVREGLYGLVGLEDKPAALNAARWEAGLFVYVPRGVEVTLPVESLLYVTGELGRVFGRTLVVLEDGARATVVDRFDSPDLEGIVQASSVVELYVGQEAELEHVAVVDWGRGVRHHHRLRARVAKDARARSVLVTLGGDVVRAEPTLVCAGPGADARALGLYFAAGEQHFEHRVVARHEAPQAYSNLLYKGAIQDRAHTVFYGNLVVPPGAPGTDAYQTNRNLVLNEGARADTIPFLEIETAEVKCSHAGAVGRVDDEQLFYLESRGVPADVAKRLIVYGFFQEVLEQIRLEELREELDAAVARKVS
jgi:Fe-S cluster assembly protein SufD